MSEWTPTRNDVKRAFAHQNDDPFADSELMAAFDRWLTAEKKDGFDAGYAMGAIRAMDSVREFAREFQKHVQEES